MGYPTYVDKSMCKICLEKALFKNELQISHVIKIIDAKYCAVNELTMEVHKSRLSKITV